MSANKPNQENTEDLFGFGDVDVDQIESLDDESHRWPEAMRQMYDILKYELDQAGQDPKLAIRQLGSICKAFGGMQFYLPRGHHLEKELTHLHIWQEFKGNNVPELSRKYNMSMQHIYRVVAKMRGREIKKRQPELF